MAVDKGKVLAAIEAKFKGKSLSKNFKSTLAEKWAAKIEKDEEIDAYVEDREDIVLEASKEADARATAATAKARQEAQEALDLAAGKKKQEAQPEDIVPEGAPDWFKAYMVKDAADKKALSEKFAAIETAKTAESIADRFKKDDRLKGVPEFMFKGRIPSTEEDFEKAATELHTDYTAFATANKISSFGHDTPGGNGGAVGGAGKGKVDSDIVSFAKAKNEAATTKN